MVQLWCEDKKKAISIINNKGYWPETVHLEIDKKKTEEYYKNKYNHFRSNLKQIVEDFRDSKMGLLAQTTTFVARQCSR